MPAPSSLLPSTCTRVGAFADESVVPINGLILGHIPFEAFK